MSTHATGDDSPGDGRRRRWQEHNVARRRAIVEAAIAVIESQAPGDDLQLQAVAERAGMSRTVIYRHFVDRADLDRAVQQQVCDDVGAAMLPALSLDGTPDEIVRRLVSSFVGWATEHQALYWFVERDPAGWGTSPLSRAVEQLAESIERVMEVVVGALDVTLGDDDLAALDPWVFGMVSAVFAAVRRWLERDVRSPGPEEFGAVLSQSIWVQVDGMARSRGINLPDLPVSALLRRLGSDDPDAVHQTLADGVANRNEDTA